MPVRGVGDKSVVRRDGDSGRWDRELQTDKQMAADKCFQAGGGPN